MRRSPAAAPLFAVLLPLAASLLGCKSAPIPTTVPAILRSPETFEGERVEVTAPVATNTFAADGHAVWRLEIGKPPETLLAYEEGMNGAVLRNGMELADVAGRAKTEVTVVGIFRLGASGSHLSGARIEMESFRSGDEAIDTDYGDVSPYSYGWYGWGPYWGPYGGWGWYHCH